MRQILILLLMTSVLFVACGKICRDKDCGVHGDCAPRGDVNKCLCEEHYTTDADGACNLETRNTFIGTWRGNHVSLFGTGSDYYNITIDAASFDLGKIKIDNYFQKTCPSGSNLQVYAKVTDGTHASISESICTEYTTNGGNITFIDPTHIKISGELRLATSTLNYEGIYEKQ